MPYGGLLHTLLEKKSVWAIWGEGGYRAAFERLDRDDAAIAAGLASNRLVEPIGDRRPLDTSLQIVFINQHKFKL